MRPRRTDPNTSTAGLAALAWVAVVVAGNGLVSVATGLEVVPIAAAGPLAEPVAVGVAATLLFLRMRVGPAAGRVPVESALIAYLALLVAGSGVAGLAGGGGTALLFAGDAALSPFVLVDAALAALAGLAVLLIARGRQAGAGRPRWPWERDEDP